MLMPSGLLLHLNAALNSLVLCHPREMKPRSVVPLDFCCELGNDQGNFPTLTMEKMSRSTQFILILKKQLPWKRAPVVSLPYTVLRFLPG